MSIRIQIVRSPGLIPRIIGFETRSWATHIEFVNNEARETLGARPGGGVAVRPAALDHYVYGEQFVLNHPSSEELLKLAWRWGLRHRGTPYNFGGVVGVATDLNLNEPQAMDCSQFVHLACWKGAGFPLISTRPSNLPWRITPRDHLLSRGLVYVGSFGRLKGKWTKSSQSAGNASACSSV